MGFSPWTYDYRQSQRCEKLPESLSVKNPLLARFICQTLGPCFTFIIARGGKIYGNKPTNHCLNNGHKCRYVLKQPVVWISKLEFVKWLLTWTELKRSLSGRTWNCNFWKLHRLYKNNQSEANELFEMTRFYKLQPIYHVYLIQAKADSVAIQYSSKETKV